MDPRFYRTKASREDERSPAWHSDYPWRNVLLWAVIAILGVAGVLFGAFRAYVWLAGAMR